MANSDEKQSPKFGGQWTFKKLNILETYLNEYTKVLKNQNFNLIYIDAFAGTGQIELLGGSDDNDRREFISGSALRALNVKKYRPFDKLLFVEKDSSRFKELKSLQDSYPDRDIQVINTDANQFLCNLKYNWKKWRGVLFLDPYATDVKWETLIKVASYNALDTWILFPVYAVSRMLPKSRNLKNIKPRCATCLTGIFGDESWYGVYREARQGELFEERGIERDSGVDEMITIYQENLKKLFNERLLHTTCPLYNSNKVRLFEFMFCVGSPSPAAIKLAKPIANHILNKM